MSQDRPELQYSVKEVCRGMSSPTYSDFQRLKRIIRYLKGAPRAVFAWPFQSAQSEVRVYSDSDWAGCKRTRKSTQGGIIMYGNHCIKSYSTTQSTIALSSAEAEYYVLVKAASCALGVKSMYSDLGHSIQINLHTGSSPAKSIASRRGLDRLRHVAVHLLWLREKVAASELQLFKINGKANPSDLLTKHLSQQDMHKYMKFMHYSIQNGRAVACPELAKYCLMFIYTCICVYMYTYS